MSITADTLFLICNTSIRSQRTVAGRRYTTYQCAGRLAESNISATMTYRDEGPPLPIGTLVFVTGQFMYTNASVEIKASNLDVRGSQHTDVDDPASKFTPNLTIDAFVCSGTDLEFRDNTCVLYINLDVHGPSEMLVRCCIVGRDMVATVPTLYLKHKVRLLGTFAGFFNNMVKVVATNFNCWPYEADMVKTPIVYYGRELPERVTRFVGVSIAIDSASQAGRKRARFSEPNESADTRAPSADAPTPSRSLASCQSSPQLAGRTPATRSIAALTVNPVQKGGLVRNQSVVSTLTSAAPSALGSPMSSPVRRVQPLPSVQANGTHTAASFAPEAQASSVAAVQTIAPAALMLSSTGAPPVMSAPAPTPADALENGSGGQLPGSFAPLQPSPAQAAAYPPLTSPARSHFAAESGPPGMPTTPRVQKPELSMSHSTPVPVSTQPAQPAASTPIASAPKSSVYALDDVMPTTSDGMATDLFDWNNMLNNSLHDMDMVDDLSFYDNHM